MEIIADTKEGYLISATKEEVTEILSAVTGNTGTKINIGQRLPAIDYASTIRKLRALPTEYKYRQLLQYTEQFNDAIKDLELAVTAATDI